MRLPLLRRCSYSRGNEMVLNIRRDYSRPNSLDSEKLLNIRRGWLATQTMASRDRAKMRSEIFLLLFIFMQEVKSNSESRLK